jgi:prepilin-type N-terminal cleavage/methylation domain-containing protein
MRRSAFTLIELVFVLLLVGILGAVATTLYKPGKLRNDAKFVKLRLQKTRYLATGYDARNFDGSFQAGVPGCIDLTPEGLEGDTSRAGAYRLQKSTIVSVSGLTGNTLCFDHGGRPHDGDHSMGTLLHEAVDISVSNGRKSYRIRLYPFSGYAAMKSE